MTDYFNSDGTNGIAIPAPVRECGAILPGSPHRDRDCFIPPGTVSVPSFSWTAEASESLAQLWESSLSASEIGVILGVSKNAVIGKVRRLGLVPRPIGCNPLTREEKRTAIARAKAGESFAQIARDLGRHASAISKAAQAPEPILPHDLPGKSLIALGSKECRYIVFGDTSLTYRFCGTPALAHSSYCEQHHKACWNPAPKRKRTEPVNFEPNGRSLNFARSR